MIRKGTINDATEMAKIFNYYVATSTVIFSERPLSTESFLPKLDGVVGEFPFFVAETDTGIMIGYCYAHRWMPDPVYGRTWEVTIYLNHNFLGQGYGRRLLQTVIDESRKMGAHSLVSFITGGNVPCEQLHMACGFSACGLIKEAGYKFGQYLDDVVYQLIL